jgi:SHS2 domain-containing protein
MAYEIIDDLSRADIAFRVRGGSLGELFSAGGRALASIMLQNSGEIRPEISVSFECTASDLELLYFDFLSELIFHKDAERLILLPARVDIEEIAGEYRLACGARGEKIDRTRHHFIVDIKAITLHHLSVLKENDTWTATVVVDV